MKSATFITVFILMCLFCGIFSIFADTPQLINYQGRLTDTNGDPLNGTYSIQFLIFDDPTSGTEIWNETHGAVSVTDGVYQVLLGSNTPFPADLFTSSIERYLELQIEGETLTPRFRFTSVSYAMQAAHSDVATIAESAEPTGVANGDLNGSYPNPTVDGIQGRAVSATAPGTDQVLKWNGSTWAPANDVSGGGGIWQSSGSDIYYNVGIVGIGNTTPYTALDVTGTVTATSFTGAGHNITGLRANNIATGTLGDERLSGTYSNALTFSNASNNFTGIGTGLTALNATNISSGTIGSSYLPTTLLPSRIIASDYITADGGMHVGGSADPGTDNLVVDGNVGIGASSPIYPLQIVPGDQVRGIDLNHTQSAAGTTYGIEVDLHKTHTGNYTTYGLNASAINDGGSSSCYGLYGRADGTSTGNKYGVYGWAGGSGTLWAGYFSGNIYTNGYLGIGTSSTVSPSYPLHIDPGSANRGIYIDFDKAVSGGSIGMRVDIDNTYATSGGGNVIGIDLHTTKDNTSDTVWGIYSLADGTTTGSKAGVYGNAGESGGTGNSYGIFGGTMGGSTRYGVYASGDLGYTGNLVAVSDRKLKENEKDLQNILPKLLRLNPKSYTHSNDKKYEHLNLAKGNQFGLVSQDVEEVFPGLVQSAVHPNIVDKEGKTVGEEINYKGVKYMELIPLLIQGMKEQQEIIEDLQMEIEKLKNN